MNMLLTKVLIFFAALILSLLILYIIIDVFQISNNPKNWSEASHPAAVFGIIVCLILSTILAFNVEKEHLTEKW